MGRNNISPRHTGACERCRKMKIKCDKQGSLPCSSCTARNSECTPAKSKRRARPAPCSPADISSIGERIAKMESLLASHSHIIGNSPTTDPGSPRSPSSLIEAQAGLSETGSLHFFKEDGESEFIGLSSGLTMFSPASLEWLSKRIGPSRTRQIKTVINYFRSSAISFCPFSASTGSLPRQELPPKRLAVVYANAFFEDINLWLPWVQRSTFDKYFEQHYCGASLGPSWYALFNSVMCLGYTAVKKMSVLKENEFNAAWAYLDNAMSVVPQLVFSSADAMGVQALLIMAVTYNSNMSFRASSMLLAMAVRLAFAKGFHRKPVGTFVPTEICRVRQNITWIAYVMDKGMCIRFGHPPLIDDDEIGIDLPAKETDAGVPSLLGHLVPLALIQSKICKWIYSPRYRTKPLEQRLRLMDELGDMLDAWKAGLPLQFQPENTPSDGPIGPVLNLHMIYYYTVASLHRASMGVCLEPQMEQAFQRASVDRAHRMEHSAQLCLSVSHATIDLLSYANGVLPQHYVTCWSVCFHVLVAALLLFVHTVNNPRRPEARSNLAYLQFFAQVIHSSPFTELSPVGKGLGALADLLVDICSSSVVSSHDILAVHGVDGADSVEAFSPPTTTTATSQELELGQPFTSQPPDQDHSDVGPSVEAASTIFDLFFQDPPDAGGSMPLSQSTNWYDGVLSLPLDQS